jgi:hypothetical protein
VPKERANTDPGPVGDLLSGGHERPVVHQSKRGFDDCSLTALTALPATI